MTTVSIQVRRRRVADVLTVLACLTVPLALFAVLKGDDALTLGAVVLGATFCLITYLLLRTPRSHM